MRYWKQGSSHRVAFVSGPRHCLLGLVVQNEPMADQDVSMVSLAGLPHAHVAEQDATSIKTAVLNAFLSARGIYKQDLYIKEIEYIPGESSDLSLYTAMTEEIAKNIAARPS